MDPTETRPVVPGPTPAPAELHEAWDALQRHGTPILISLVIVLAVLGGYRLLTGRAEATRRDAQMMLSSAQSFDDLERVVADYAKAPAAPLALLKLGQVHYAAGNYALALQKYGAFLATYAGHALAPAAELGSIQCQEAQGQLADALAAYKAFADGHGGHFLAPEARFGEGRCLEQLGRLTEARTRYEQFIAENPESAWLPRAEESLDRVTRLLARASNPAATPPVAEAAPTAAVEGAVPITLPSGFSAITPPAQP